MTEAEGNGAVRIPKPDNEHILGQQQDATLFQADAFSYESLGENDDSSKRVIIP